MNLKEKKGSFERYLLLIPIIFAIAIIPNIVRVMQYNPELAPYQWYPMKTEVLDMFAYYKHQAMMVLDAVLVAGLVYLGIKRKVAMPMSFLPLAIYFIMVVLSSIMSIVPVQTWKGFCEMLESAFTLFGYCLICYYTYLVIESEKQLKILGIALILGMIFLCGVGLTQFVEKDFFMTGIGKELLFLHKFAEYKDTFSLNVKPGVVYTTLGNANYVGAYAALLLPLFVILAVTAKKKLHTVIYCVVITALMICLVGSKSKTAFLVLLLGVIIMFFYFRQHYWKRMLLILLLCVVEFVALNLYQGDGSLWAKTVITLSKTKSIAKSEQRLKDITLNDDNYEILYDEELLSIRHVGDGELLAIDAVDSNGKIITISVNEEQNAYILNDKRFDGLEFVLAQDRFDNMGFFVRFMEKEFFIFYSEIDETYCYRNCYGRAVKLYPSETFETPLFSIMNGFSSRGYIWAKSIPLLKDTLIVGSGPDTYAFMFPQYDYVDLVLSGWEGKIITKPHSMYLQIGIQTGVVSLVAFLIFNIIYIIDSLKLYYQRKMESFVECFGAGILVGVVGFLGAMITTDSTIGVSILYWTLLGVGYACNRILKNSMR